MPNAALWIGLLVVVIVLLVGVFLFRSPQEAAVPLSTTSIEEESGPSQFDTEVPTTSPVATTTPTPSATATASPAAASASISISDTGFSPATLTVPANTTVTFTNNGQGAHWPASAPHPTHTGLPGFDAKRGLATGETYSFTFTKKGTWAFHDHLNPQMTGSVVVQ